MATQPEQEQHEQVATPQPDDEQQPIDGQTTDDLSVQGGE